MWQPKQNNLPALDSLTTLPGETEVDKNAAWQKLALRLHQRPRRIKAVWYWAAACVAVLVLFLSLNVTKHNEPVIAHSLKAPSSLAGAVFPAKKNEAVAVIPAAKKTAYAAVSFSVPVHRFKSVVKIPAPGSAAVSPVPEYLSSIDLPPAVDSSSLVSAPPAKKKLKVINTNELDDADRFAAQHLPKTGTNYTKTKNAAKKEYAGILNFRIYLKN